MRNMTWLQGGELKKAFYNFYLEIPRVLLLTIITVFLFVPIITIGPVVCGFCNSLRDVADGKKCRIKKYFSIIKSMFFRSVIFSLLMVVVSVSSIFTFNMLMSNKFGFVIIGFLSAICILIIAAASLFLPFILLEEKNFITGLYKSILFVSLHVSDSVILISLLIILIFISIKISFFSIFLLLPFYCFVLALYAVTNNRTLEEKTK